MGRYTSNWCLYKATRINALITIGNLLVDVPRVGLMSDMRLGLVIVKITGAAPEGE